MDRETDYIDADGYRANVGIVLMNDDRQVFIGGRVGARGWQFPQGGIRRGERPEDALYRELTEEVGLRPRAGRGGRAHAELAALPPAAAVRAPRFDAALHRPEAALVPAEARRRRFGAALRRDRAAAGVRPLALGATGGMRCTTSSISSAASTRARCTSSARTRSRRGCRPIRRGGASARAPARAGTADA